MRKVKGDKTQKGYLLLGLGAGTLCLSSCFCNFEDGGGGGAFVVINISHD